MQGKISKFNEKIKDKSTEEILIWAYKNFENIVFGSAFGAEDVVLIDFISKLDLNIKIFFLDTGRLPEETYELVDIIQNKYKNIKIETYFPNTEEVEKLERKKGFYSFRKSLENRRECCKIRKINPLKKALNNKEAWITGLRKNQSITRQNISFIEEDSLISKLIKINPLKNWTNQKIWKYIKENKVPYNKLHDKNYPSIGCQPCTRAIKNGEDIRAGRWWWESPEHKECGLHLKK